MTTVWRVESSQAEPQMIAAGTNCRFKHLMAAQGASLRKDETMRKLGLAAALAASVAVTGCATYPDQYGYDPYGYNNGYYNNG